MGIPAAMAAAGAVPDPVEQTAAAQDLKVAGEDAYHTVVVKVDAGTGINANGPLNNQNPAMFGLLINAIRCNRSLCCV